MSRLSRGRVTSGDLAVDGFFVISGFLITYSWLAVPSLRKFFMKRALRIYPAYLMVAVVCLLVFEPLAAASTVRLYSPRSLEVLVLRCLTLQEIKLNALLAGVPVGRHINLSTWTIRYEFLCYMAVPILGLLGLYRRRGRALALFVAWMAFYALVMKGYFLFGSGDTGGAGIGSKALARLGAFFLAGMCFCLYRDRILRSRWLFALSLIALTAFLVRGHALELALPIFGTYALLYIIFCQKLNLAKFGRHGDFSYGAYLYHYPIQVVLVHYLRSSLHPASLLLLAAPITGLFAWASWTLVEEPCLKRKPR